MYEFEFVGTIKYSDDNDCYEIDFNEDKYDCISFMIDSFTGVSIRERICMVAIALKDLRSEQMLNVKMMP